MFGLRHKWANISHTSFHPPNYFFHIPFYQPHQPITSKHMFSTHCIVFHSHLSSNSFNLLLYFRNKCLSFISTVPVKHACLQILLLISMTDFSKYNLCFFIRKYFPNLLINWFCIYVFGAGNCVAAPF